MRWSAICLCKSLKWKLFHTYTHPLSDSPSPKLKDKIMQMKKKRRSKANKDDISVEVPRSKKYLDTATMPMFLTAIAIALFTKILMMYDESKAQERIERKARKAPPEQGTLRMLSREEWEEIQEIRPRTPFESKIARPNARIRTGDPINMDDLKDWSIDVLTDAFTRVEENIQYSTKRRLNAIKDHARHSGISDLFPVGFIPTLREVFLHVGKGV